MQAKKIIGLCLSAAFFLCTAACDPSRAATVPVSENTNSFAVKSSSADFSHTNMEKENDKGSWVQKAPMSTARKWFQTAVVNGKIYAMGGTDEYDGYSHGLSTVEEYDPMLDHWAKKAPMLSTRLNFRTEVIDGKIYAIGGFNGQGDPLSSMEEYDSESNKWIAKASMSAVRTDFQTEVIDG